MLDLNSLGFKSFGFDILNCPSLTTDIKNNVQLTVYGCFPDKRKQKLFEHYLLFATWKANYREVVLVGYLSPLFFTRY